jgi:hypothetical protein
VVLQASIDGSKLSGFKDLESINSFCLLCLLRERDRYRLLNSLHISFLAVLKIKPESPSLYKTLEVSLSSHPDAFFFEPNPIIFLLLYSRSSFISTIQLRKPAYRPAPFSLPK